MELFDHDTLTQKAKSAEYRRIAIIQTILIIVGLLLDDVLAFLSLGELRGYFLPIHLLMIASYFFLLWTILKGLVESRALIMSTFVTLIGVLASFIVLESPLYFLFPDRVHGLVVGHLLFVVIESFVIVRVFKDVFALHEVTTNNLWGAVSLLFMFSITFASIYNIVFLMQPGCVGLEMRPGFDTFSEALYTSLVAVIGNSPEYPMVSEFVRDIVTIEGFGGAMYLVILMGRMIGMATPSRNEPGQKRSHTRES